MYQCSWATAEGRGSTSSIMTCLHIMTGLLETRLARGTVPAAVSNSAIVPKHIHLYFSCGRLMAR